jgi:cyclopropane fatty-acyl-phospholipid synthase-like methyltransferase
MTIKLAEFDGERAKLYEEAINEFPSSRIKDIQIMKKLLNPIADEYVIGFGEGNGYFSEAIANSIGRFGKYLIIDPSIDQLKNLKKRVNLPQIEIQILKAEEIQPNSIKYDKIWSFGAFHHFTNQTSAMKRIYNSLKKGGIAVICDVFQGSKLANHFDAQVARYCITGHEVKFLSKEFAKTLCLLAGFKEKNIAIVDLHQKWIFNSEEDLGKFIYKLHALTLLPGNEEQKINKVIKACKRFLGINYKNGKYLLNWPMKALIIKK